MRNNTSVTKRRFGCLLQRKLILERKVLVKRKEIYSGVRDLRRW